MYKVVDTLGIYKDRILSEKEVRDIYKESVKETFWNWLDYKEKDRKEILGGFMDELANVYTCDMQFVINNLKYDLSYSVEKINEKEVKNENN